MKELRTIVMIFVIVSVCALVGMVMGGLFGLAAGTVAPDLFSTLIPWKDIEPVGAATVCGAVAGVLLGGGLGVFATLMAGFMWLLKAWRGKAAIDA